MRITCGLAITLWLCLLAPRTTCAQKPPEAPAAADSSSKPSQSTDSAEASTDSKSKKPVAKKRHKRTGAEASGDPRKVVVREGGAKEPPAQIAPGLAPDESDRQRRDAEQWLSSADGQLKVLAGRQLGARQQEALGQVHNYLTGARSALKEGDMRRASTLALKAHLLAEDLVRH
jgi:hypothetical protein